MNDLDLGVDSLKRLVVTHNDWDHTYGAYALLVSLFFRSVNTQATS
jgi:phosphoribosyl 1,2-cyclic phosphodiesterase